MAASLAIAIAVPPSSGTTIGQRLLFNHRRSSSFTATERRFLPSSFCLRRGGRFISACLPSPPPSASTSRPKTRLFISGLSFRTTEESLRNAFKTFGELVEVNLVMDKIANRPRGFAFLRYATEDESQKAIEGMHGKFLDGRVIFVEVAKPRSELRQGLKQTVDNIEEPERWQHSKQPR